MLPSLGKIRILDQTESLVLILHSLGTLFSSVFIGAAVLWLPMCSVGRRLKQVAKAHCNTKVQTLLRAVFK